MMIGKSCYFLCNQSISCLFKKLTRWRHCRRNISTEQNWVFCHQSLLRMNYRRNHGAQIFDALSIISTCKFSVLFVFQVFVPKINRFLMKYFRFIVMPTFTKIMCFKKIYKNESNGHSSQTELNIYSQFEHQINPFYALNYLYVKKYWLIQFFFF